MSNGPPSRDRRSLQDLAKLASSSNLGGLSKTPPPAAVTVTEAVHDSGIVDLKQIAKADEGAEARSKTTPLASAPLFEEETPAVPGPSSRPSSAPGSSKSGGESAPASAPRPVAAAHSAPGSQPRASAVAAVAAAPASAGSKMPVVLVVGVLGVVALAAVLARSSKTEPTPPAATQVVATAATATPAATTATPAASQPAAAETAVASAGAVAPDDSPQAAAGAPDKGGAANAGNGGRKQPAGAGAKVPSGPGGSTISPLAAMMAQSTGATAAPGAPVPTAAPGALGEAVEHAVGPGGAAPAAEAPAAATPQYAAGTVPEKPSQGAVTGALGRALPAARSCLNPDDPISKANVTFSSNGLVSAVTVTGSAAGKPAEHCIKSALLKTSVPPFSQDSYSATVTVRPN